MPSALRFHSHSGHAAYQDLRRRLMDAAVSEIRGTPTRLAVKGRYFWYDKYRVGTEVRQRYIGPETDGLLARLDRLADLRRDRRATEREQARLIRFLRADSYNSLDRGTGSLLASFAGCGVFRLGGTLIGAVAFQHYEGELGVVMDFERIARTDDIDIASFERLSFAIGDSVETPLEEVFRELKFQPVPSLDQRHVWRWRQTTGSVLVEFLMPAHGEEGIRRLPTLGVSARALRHLDYLLEDPVPAVSLYRSGVLVRIPRPERFAIHKLIVAERRRGGPDSLKASKDRAQADFLIAALAEMRPDELALAYGEAMGRGPGWSNRITASLNRLPGARERVLGVVGADDAHPQPSASSTISGPA